MAQAEFPMRGEPSSLPAFDAAKFQALTIDDPDLQQHLIRSFLAQVGDMCTELDRSAAEGGLWFEDALHRLKGTAHFVAATRLADTLEQVESMDLESDASARHQAVARIHREVAELAQALAQERMPPTGAQFDGR